MVSAARELLRLLAADPSGRALLRAALAAAALAVGAVGLIVATTIGGC